MIDASILFSFGLPLEVQQSDTMCLSQPILCLPCLLNSFYSSLYYMSTGTLNGYLNLTSQLSCHSGTHLYFYSLKNSYHLSLQILHSSLFLNLSLYLMHHQTSYFYNSFRKTLRHHFFFLHAVIPLYTCFSKMIDSFIN